MREERVAEAVQRHLDEAEKLSCAAAFCVARELDVAPCEVGRAADGLGARLSRCQLGLFGYGPKVEGKHKVVKPAEELGPDLVQAIQGRMEEGELSCRAAWDIAAELRTPKLEVAAVAEALEIKIVRCQLGAF